MPSLLHLDLASSPWLLSVLTHLWQSSAVALAVLLLLTRCHGLPAKTRRTLGWIALAKFAVPAAWLAQLMQLAVGAPQPWLEVEPVLLPMTLTLAPVVVQAAEPARGLSLTQLALGVWAAGGAALLAFWIVRARHARERVLRGAIDAPAELTARLEAAAARVGPCALPRCYVVDDDRGPGLVGITSPCLVLPRGLAESLKPAELDAILVHEYVHLRRRDNLWSALRAGFVATLWFNPVAWWLNRVISIETEKSCDERVLEITGDEVTYADSIVASARHTLGVARPGFSAATTPPVVARIENILAHPARRDRPLRRWLAVGSGLALAGSGGHAGAIAAGETRPAATRLVAAQTPASAAEQVSPVPTAAKGPTLSIDFPDEDVRRIVKNVADLFELAVVMPDSLQGRTSIKLRDVTWQEIFQAVLTPLGYGFVEEGKTVKIVLRMAGTSTLHSTPIETPQLGQADPLATPVSAPSVVELKKYFEGPEVQGAKLVRPALARYPEQLRGSGQTGRVELALLVDTSGTVASVKVVSSTDATFEPAAIEAAKRWAFEPVMIGGKPTLAVVKMPIEFREDVVNATTSVRTPVSAAVESPRLADPVRATAARPGELPLDAGGLAQARQKRAETLLRLRVLQAEREALLAKKEAEDARKREREGRIAELRSDARVYEARELDRAPVPRFQARPRYPFDMRRSGITGEALVDFIIDANGDVVNARAVKSSRAEFEEPAVQAVERWKYRPGEKTGQPVPTHLQVPIKFEITAP